MKPVMLNFMSDRRWVWVWAITGIVVLGMMALTGWRWFQSDLARRETERQINFMQQQLQDRTIALKAQDVPDPRQASIEQALRLLHQNLNPLFATVENLQESGVRLQSLSLDANADSVRLEYVLDTLPRAASVTAVLNAGFEEQRPWRLESVVEGQTGGGGASQSLLGIWVSGLRKL